LYNIRNEEEEKYESYEKPKDNVNDNTYDTFASSNVPQTKLSSLSPSQRMSFVESSSVADKGKSVLDPEKEERINDVVIKSKNFPVCLRDLEPLMPHCCEPFLNDFHFSWSFDHNHPEILSICLLKLVKKELENENKKVKKEIEKINQLSQMKWKLEYNKKKYPTFDDNEEKVYFIFFFFFFLL
jgi:hypothetical protein